MASLGNLAAGVAGWLVRHLWGILKPLIKAWVATWKGKKPPGDGPPSNT